MARDIRIRECSTGVSEDVASYWEQKLPRIERLLTRFAADQRQLRLSFACGETGYTALARLVLPTGTLLVRIDPPAPEHRAAIDQLVDKLTAEIRRHKERLRHEDVHHRRRRRERDFAAAEPHLTLLHRERDRDAFFDVLQLLLRNLRDHARRELLIAQLEGDIPPGELTVSDLLDEVLLRAWDEWNDRPRHQPLDRWLVRLLHEILDERGFKPPDERDQSNAPAAAAKQPVSLYERLREDDPRYEAENGWAIENNPYWPWVEPLTLDEVLPAEEATEPWQQLTAAEQRCLILDELNSFPREQRRAFTLHVLEGWDIVDIAMVQGRAADEVWADIEAVRRALRERLEKVAVEPT
jgi:DNA-directed RNA polymerase specialized sigma24 family protein/ribosome-associated translation inhibitor RaiA